MSDEQAKEPTTEELVKTYSTEKLLNAVAEYEQLQDRLRKSEPMIAAVKAELKSRL